MPRAILLSINDPEVPNGFVKVPCTGCDQPGWCSRMQADWPNLERFCRSCYWLVLSEEWAMYDDDLLKSGLEPGSPGEGQPERDDHL